MPPTDRRGAGLSAGRRKRHVEIKRGISSRKPPQRGSVLISSRKPPQVLYYLSALVALELWTIPQAEKRHRVVSKRRYLLFDTSCVVIFISAHNSIFRGTSPNRPNTCQAAHHDGNIRRQLVRCGSQQAAGDRGRLPGAVEGRQDLPPGRRRRAPPGRPLGPEAEADAAGGQRRRQRSSRRRRRDGRR